MHRNAQVVRDGDGIASPENGRVGGHPVSAVVVGYEDDPATAARQRAQDYASDVVPTSGRLGRWQVAMSGWSLVSAMVWLFYGALVAELYGTQQAVIGIAAAVALYSVGSAVLTRWTVASGLNASLLSRRMFGLLGGPILALLVGVTVVYYAVFESSTLAVAFHSYVGHLDIKLWYAIVVFAMIPLMTGGVQTWLARLNGLLLPLFVIGLVAAVVDAAIEHGPGSHWWSFAGLVPPIARPVPGWLLVIVLYLGLTINLPATMEFSRFGRREDSGFHSLGTFGPVFYVCVFGLNGLAGIFLTQVALTHPATVEAGVVQAILATMGIWGLLFIVVTQTRINSLNYYLSSVNFERLVTSVTGRRPPRAALVGLLSVAVFLLMLTDVFSWLQKALTWQGIGFVGWAGIVFTHIALVRGDRGTAPEFRATRLPLVTPGLLAWAVSAGVGIWLVEDHSISPTLTALAPAIALAVSVVLYAAGLLLWRSVVSDAPRDVRNEVDDPWEARVRCGSCDRAYIALALDRDPDTDAVVCDECATASRMGVGSSRRPASGRGEREPVAAPSGTGGVSAP